jgi:hypothetical protein
MLTSAPPPCAVHSNTSLQHQRMDARSAGWPARVRFPDGTLQAQCCVTGNAATAPGGGSRTARAQLLSHSRGCRKGAGSAPRTRTDAGYRKHTCRRGPCRRAHPAAGCRPRRTGRRSWHTRLRMAHNRQHLSVVAGLWEWQQLRHPDGCLSNRLLVPCCDHCTHLCNRRGTAPDMRREPGRPPPASPPPPPLESAPARSAATSAAASPQSTTRHLLSSWPAAAAAAACAASAATAALPAHVRGRHLLEGCKNCI